MYRGVFQRQKDKERDREETETEIETWAQREREGGERERWREMERCHNLIPILGNFPPYPVWRREEVPTEEKRISSNTGHDFWQQPVKLPARKSFDFSCPEYRQHIINRHFE